jgi:acyl-[acyl-carrier-protein]-phospholipid O-acyltransferase/long-chain-fatty-acid--[acyl-carrier-protein] ligase
MSASNEFYEKAEAVESELVGSRGLAVIEKLSGRSFISIVITQFLGAFNDNAFKQLILLVAVDLAMKQDVSYYQPLAGAVFAIPFVLFSGFAGSLSDRFSKTFIIRFCKVWEILVMVLGGVAFFIEDMTLLFFTLFLMGAQSAFFGPGKYGIFPELLPPRSLSKANGIVLMTTYLAITLGTASAGLLKDGLEAEGDLYKAQGGLVLLAILGTMAAFGIRRAPVADPEIKLKGKVIGDLLPTLKSIFADRSFRCVALTYAYFWGLGAALLMLCNSYGKVLMKLDDAPTSMLLVYLSVGIALGAFGGGLISKGKVDFRVYYWGLGLLLASLAALVWAHLAVLAASGTLFILGLAGGMFALPLQTSVQLWSQENLRGRVIAAVNFLCFISIFLSSLVFYLARQYVPIEWIGVSLAGLTVMVHLLARRGLSKAAEQLS